jgi:hypothetical protein
MPNHMLSKYVYFEKMRSVLQHILTCLKDNTFLHEVKWEDCTITDSSSDKTKYMVMSRDQNAGRNHNIRIDNSSFEREDEFKYLGTTLTNQNSIQEEVKE